MPRVARPARHRLSIPGIAADGRFDPASRLHDAPDERVVLLLDFPQRELPRQFLMGAVVFGDHHDSRRAAVEPMDDPGTRRAASAFTSVPRACPAAGCTTIPAGLLTTTTSASS
jgi:hypothetical protein